MTATTTEALNTLASFKVGDKVFHDRDPQGLNLSNGAGVVVAIGKHSVRVEWNGRWIPEAWIKPYHLIKA